MRNFQGIVFVRTQSFNVNETETKKSFTMVTQREDVLKSLWINEPLFLPSFFLSIVQNVI